MNKRLPRLPPNQQLIRSERWPVVGEAGPRTDDDRPWRVTVKHGDSERVYSLDDLQRLGLQELLCDVHCVTRWSKWDMRFGGVPLTALFPSRHREIDSFQGYISFVARSERRHSTSLPWSEALRLGAFVALTANGVPLPREHGGPVRIVVPGKYFYKSLKWLETIELLPADRLGYWEAEAGYHNGADPWLEERYIASKLSKQQAAELIASRDFSGRDLMGLSAADRDLENLHAAKALLRAADFRGSQLRNSDFREANLSNARFGQADLRGACFVAADIDGADFVMSDLRGADLSVATMFGTTFCQIDEQGRVIAGASRLDDTCPTREAGIARSGTAGLAGLSTRLTARKVTRKARRTSNLDSQVPTVRIRPEF